MGFALLATMIAVPIVEIAVFIEAGERLGLWPTLAAVVVTAVVGSALLRLQGLSTLRRAQASVEAGELPVEAVFDGVCLLFAGALLLTPGFVTDTVGLALFAPPVRAGLRRWATRFLVSSGRAHVWTNAGPPPGSAPGSATTSSSSSTRPTPSTWCATTTRRASSSWTAATTS